ncbi:unnamed protein product [Kluyveromyces dobzhanskii CBS 2104]|uniref:WGS project CCBQ000000000 data, contig 00009 n=1 Tax=Kluyveromyces dobzhanskii CBS 2104 TaxID=1427455 RepID=A0A0A8L5C1_9SACH|nr:unnamed protein product [Kluyveromyces dobzhanskii CBS 2104]
MFFRRLSLRGDESSQPPEYAENDVLNHAPFVSLLRKSKNGPMTVPLTDCESSSPTPVLTAVKKIRKLGSTAFQYNAFDEYVNKPRTVHDCKLLRMELKLDTDTVYMSSLLEPSEQNAGPSSFALTGRIMLTVKEPSSVVQDLKIRLNGYSTEFYCTIDPALISDGEEDPMMDPESQIKFLNKSSRTRLLKLLKDPADGRVSYLKPFVTDEIDGFEKYPIVLNRGTYVIPFCFSLDPEKHHSSFKSLVGSTTYRMEALLTVKHQKSSGSATGCHNDYGELQNYFILQKCYITKTLSPSSMLKFEPVSSSGTYDKDLLDYEFYVSSKLVELNSPFHCQFNGVAKPGLKIDKVTVSLLQASVVPAMTADEPTVVKKLYRQCSTFQLAEYTAPIEESSGAVAANFGSLKIVPGAEGNCFTNKVLPYYKESSRLKTANGRTVSKLTISHSLKITVRMVSTEQSTASGPKKKKVIHVNFKIPITIVDKDMGSSLDLPAYKPPLLGVTCQPSPIHQEELASISLSSSSADSPPTYSSLCH